MENRLLITKQSKIKCYLLKLKWELQICKKTKIYKGEAMEKIQISQLRIFLILLKRLLQILLQHKILKQCFNNRISKIKNNFE